MDRYAQLVLPAATTSPTAARLFVRNRLDEWGLSTLADDLSLVASELVTNAVVHAGSPSTVTLSVAAGVVELSVADRDPRLPEPRPHRGDLLRDLDATAALAAHAHAADGDPRHHTLVVGDAGSVMAGRGLLIIEALASDWGTTQLSQGKAVWVHLPVPAGVEMATNR